MAIMPLGIWSYSVLETWNSPATTQETYVKHRVYTGAAESHNSRFLGQGRIGV